jgi:transcriptional regulator with XRE-family HTH domain
MTEQSEDFQQEIDAALANPHRRARVEQYGRQIDLILALSAVREAVGMTQEDFAAAAMMSQENVSRIERATDVKISTIQRLARTAGAQLELTAVMPGGTRVPLLRPRSEGRIVHSTEARRSESRT